ncbi:MGMT family protein [Sedimenticola selenatireducens]|uniref:Cysteine methyltransferase n=1 Tax=Sedimenticola selenatireducens TaxID=191960 RepID=A0A557SCP5_9GAMM|nr:MGMT family protein [Sedimenticola selenatireducens]TVO75198.1 cysteine methyltransferase [Sedimenticola selenatireducens]TVT66948.1 MAG: cysteine methyltransferase [Sedimenticola selenatireducens]
MTAKVHPHERIWRTVLVVPEGRVASYGQIADLAGLPGRARMVGKVLGLAPDELNVPWYRILRSDGRIAFPAGSESAERQKQRLQEEDVVVLRNRVKLAEFGWKPDLAELLMKLEF